MRLEEAYERIRLKSPLSFERSATGAPLAFQFGARRIGSSVHMLVELYLDLADAVQEVGLQDRHRVRFLVVCLHRDQGIYLREALHGIHGVLEADVDLYRQVTFFPENANPNRLRGLDWYSWGIFCDHAVKERQDLDRSLGPYRLVRSLERGNKAWTTRDRDGRVVCHLTDDGMRELVDATPCPVTYRPHPKVPPVTYPAWFKHRNKINVRLTRAFQL